MLGRIIEWIEQLFSVQPSKKNKTKKIVKPPILFSELTVVEKTPRNNDVEQGLFYLVYPNRKKKWVLFLCPCGCGYVITLSLKNLHNPHWRLNIGKEGRPTLYPSVWQKTECRSHFWLRDGRIYWC